MCLKTDHAPTTNFFYSGKLEYPSNIMVTCFDRYIWRHNLLFSPYYRVLENYAKWQLLLKLLPTMSSEFTNIYYLALRRELGELLWKCITVTESSRYGYCITNFNKNTCSLLMIDSLWYRDNCQETSLLIA